MMKLSQFTMDASPNTLTESHALVVSPQARVLAPGWLHPYSYRGNSPAHTNYPQMAWVQGQQKVYFKMDYIAMHAAYKTLFPIKS